MQGKPISRETAEELFNAYCNEPIPFPQICEKRGILPNTGYALLARHGFDFHSVDRKIQCVECGKLFKPRNGNHILCSAECKKKRSKQQMKNWGTNHKKRADSKNSVADLATEARAHGMSYGKYVAMIQQEGS